MKLIPGLNGLRGIAVILVIISHRFPIDHPFHTFPLGSIGVDIFFVLSGFLISRILFENIKELESEKVSRTKLVKNFFFRRILRIFPIYYLTLIFIYFSKGLIGNNYSENALWYFFYGANYLNYFENKWFGPLAHLWSLSVEEQFYLLWPFLLFFIIKQNKIFLALIICIAFGTLFPFFISGNSSILTLSCINAFGIGSLLAYFEILDPINVTKFLKTIKYIFIPTLLIVVINFTIYKIPYFSNRFAISIIAVAIISYCRYYPSSSMVRYLLGNKLLSLIGMLSYGIYLYHNLIPKYWRYGLYKLGIETSTSFNYSYFFLQTIFIIIFSYFSWICIEKPILKLKKHFI
jgi:peptidoglycan/LPS O-acetylase OafA/YrhL